MKINHQIKVLIGFATIGIMLSPIALGTLLFSPFLTQNPNGLQRLNLSSSFIEEHISILITLLITTTILNLALIMFYIVHASKNDTISKKVRSNFALYIFTMSLLAIPIYYVFFILRDTPPKWAQNPDTKIKNLKQKEKQNNLHKQVLWVLGFVFVVVVTVFFVNRNLSYLMGLERRTALDTETAKLLWQKEIDFTDTYQFTEIFALPDNQILFWHPSASSLVSLNAMTGEILWQTNTPRPYAMKLLGEQFLVASFESTEPIINQGEIDEREDIECSSGSSALQNIDTKSGTLNWNYRYYRVDPYDLDIEENNIFLIGTHNNGMAESRIGINPNTGDIIVFECNPSLSIQKTDYFLPKTGPCCKNQPYSVVPKNTDLSQLSDKIYFVVYRSRIEFVQNLGTSNETTHQLSFRGYRLDSEQITLTMSNNIVVLYLMDSGQLFAFQLE